MTDDVFWSVVRTYIDDNLSEIEYKRQTYRLQKSSPKRKCPSYSSSMDTEDKNGVKIDIPPRGGKGKGKVRETWVF